MNYIKKNLLPILIGFSIALLFINLSQLICDVIIKIEIIKNK
jgi:hypothetical protein